MHLSGHPGLGHPGLGPEIGQVHIGLATVDDRVGLLTGPLGRRPVGHRDEAVPLALTGLAVVDDHRLLDIPELLEEVLQGLVGSVVGKTPDEDLGEGGVLGGDTSVVGHGEQHDCR